MKPRARRVVAIAGPALLAGALMLALLFPGSCSDDDAPPGPPPPKVACPEASTRIGLVWPNLYLGLALAPLAAVGAGALAGALVARRRPR